MPLAAMSLGNEPGYSADYPSMTTTAAQEAKLAKLVGPMLHGSGASSCGPSTTTGPTGHATTRSWLAHPAPSVRPPSPATPVRRRDGRGSPAPPIVTECTGTENSWRASPASDAQHLVTEQASPPARRGCSPGTSHSTRISPLAHVGLEAGCSSCRGLLTVDGNDVVAGPEFYVLAHLARAAILGARVLGSERHALMASRPGPPSRTRTNRGSDRLQRHRQEPGGRR